VRYGFTVAELLVVLLVIGLMAALLVPNLEVVRFRMDGAARGAAAALVAAQRLAVQRQHDVIVACDTANRRLRIHEDRDNDGAVDSGEPTRIVAFDDGVVFGLGGAPARPGRGAVVDFTETQDGLPVVRFTRSGSASEDGGFYLTSERWQRNPDYAKDTRSIQVDRPTGRVTWYAYDPPRWAAR
jgi:prepilin-type N-terminal cleavage/methylation domain-containing protein